MDRGSGEIGDPWCSSTTPTFNAMQATQPSVALGTDAGVTRTTQSMVLDVTWH